MGGTRAYHRIRKVRPKPCIQESSEQSEWFLVRGTGQGVFEVELGLPIYPGTPYPFTPLIPVPTTPPDVSEMYFCREGGTVLAVQTAIMITASRMRIQVNTTGSSRGFFSINGGQARYVSTTGIPNRTSSLGVGSMNKPV